MSADAMSFSEALRYAKATREDCDVMRDKNNPEEFHVIRAFGVKHWERHYISVTRIRMVHKITGRKK